jgi:hypothetical protein
MLNNTMSNYTNYFAEKAGFSIGGLGLSIVSAIALIIIGVFLGKLAKFILRKVSDNLNLHKIINYKFIELFLVIIKWSIYVLFINLALFELNIPALTGGLTNVLVIIPALTVALILLAVGLGIATYLREVIVDSEINNWKTASTLIYYFVIYVFGIYSLKLALISLNPLVSDSILVVVTLVAGVFLTLSNLRSKNVRKV